MRQIYIKLYAFFVVSVIGITIGVFIFHIIGDVEQEVENAKIAFGKFENAVIKEVEQSYLSDDVGRNKLKKVADLLEIKGFVVQLSPSVGTVFSYPKDSSLFSVVNGNVLVREESHFLKVFRTDSYVKVEDERRGVHITMLRSILPSNMLFVRSRTIFFIMLFLILLTALAILLLQFKPFEKVERIYTNFADYSCYNNAKNREDVGFSSTKDDYAVNNEDVHFESRAKLNADGSIFSNKDSISNDKMHDSFRDGYSSKVENDFSIENASVEIKAENTNVNENPYGLYSPSTGVGWKGYLVERLNSELKRSSIIDQDLSFVIIKIFDVDYSTVDLKKLADIVVEYFRFRDMVFEYSDAHSFGFAGVLQDAYIDDAIRICTYLFQKLQHEIYLTGQEPTIKVGITTRDCRLVGADAVILEAEEALSKAIKNECESIVAFRPNAEKYRKISNKEQNV